MTTTLTASRPPVHPMVPRRFVVEDSRQDTGDTWTLRLSAEDGGALAFEPGQFTMLQAFGVGEVPISISGDPAQPAVLQHTIRAVGSVSRALATAPSGAVLGVRGPFGTGWQVEHGHGGDVVFLTGGIGLAPLRPAVLQVCAARDDYGEVSVLYGARTPADLLYAEDLRAWADQHRIAVEVIVDASSPAWTGRVGLVTQLLGGARFDPDHTLALVCGPEVMMRHCAVALQDRGVAASRIRLSMERNMQCGIGLCGHCQLREHFLCVDGPVLPYDVLAPLIGQAEL